MRLGIYGGTFSPPHIGHINAAAAFIKEMNLDKLLIIPTYLPPHKAYGEEASPRERLDMCRLSFGNIENAEISDLEIRRGGKSYTYLTLEELSGEGVELFFLCGTDMILTMNEWKNYKRIFELATICYVRRERDKANDDKIAEKIKEYTTLGAKVIKINHEVLEISSTQLRQALQSGKGTVEMIEPATLIYIIEGGLYR